MCRKDNDRLFNNNRSKNQKASEIVRNSRKWEQETIRKEEYELEQNLWHVEILQDLKYERQERMAAGDEEDEAVNAGEWCDLLKIEGRTFYGEWQIGSRSKTERRFDTRRKV